MNTYAILPLCPVILNFLLLIFILTKGRKKKLNQAFAILSLSVMVWNFGYFLLYIAPSKNTALLIRHINFLGVVFMPPTLLYFVMVLINKFTKQTKIVCLTAFTSSFILFLLNFKGFTTSDVLRYHWGYLPLTSKTGVVFTSLFVVYNF